MRGARLHLASDSGGFSDLETRLNAALLDAPDLDQVARVVVLGFREMPGATRVGLALSEGGGRRLRFTSSTAVTDDEVDWCHIDAYDDVPLTTVVRTGEAIVSARSQMDRRYAGLVDSQPAEVRGFAVVPLPGTGSPIGGVILYLDREWTANGPERRRLDSITECVAEAVRRVRAPGSGARDRHEEDDRSGRLVLADDPQSVRKARGYLRQFFDEAGIPDEALDAAQLCLSELATNALVHASGSYELQVEFQEPLLTVAVRDHGQPGMNDVGSENRDEPLGVSGRGLQLVEALVDRWGVEREADGTTVWFVLDVDAASSEATG